ncbi:MAG: amidohydrolase family protein [Patescibacteria group bacterium]
MNVQIPRFLDLKTQILDGIKKKGGWINCHAHLDRAYTLTPELYAQANARREEKWSINADLRKNSTVSQIYDRMAMATERLLEQGVVATGSFIDVDKDVQDKAIKAAQKLREAYKGQMIFRFQNQSSYGILNPEGRKWFDEAVQFVDIVGGLLKADQGKEAEHLDILLGTANELNKMVQIHVDENNISTEHETAIVAQKVIEHKLQGRVTGVHGISINARPKEERERIYHLMKKADLMMIACPVSWINARRNEELTPTHNPVTPLDELDQHGIVVGLGLDNIHDVFMPYNDADMWTDLRMLFEMNRFYDVGKIIDIATDNGRKVLGIA